MTTPPTDPAIAFAATEQAIAAGLTLVDALRPEAVGAVSVTDELNLSQISCRLPGSALSVAATNLTAAASSGHRVAATYTVDSSDLSLQWLPDGHVAIEVTGDPSDLVGQRDVEALTRAIGRDDGHAALSLLAGARFVFELVIRAPVGQAGWVASLAVLTGRLTDGRWGSVLAQLSAWGGSERALVLVHDGGDAQLVMPGLICAGPDAELDHAPVRRDRQVTRMYQDRPGFISRPDLFTPAELVQELPEAGTLAALAECFAAAARALTWYWLADSVELTSDRVRVRFQGVSTVDFDLLGYGAGRPVEEVALAAWAMATGEPARADAVQQAITFAVRGANDLLGAAAPVLRTSRSLYELAGRGLISEALAARRSARESALNAAGSAASTARDVAANSVERTAAIVIAAAAALFANTRDFLANGTSYIILTALAAIAGAALTVAIRVDTKSGYGLLDAFNTDVGLYRDTLSEDDIVAVKNVAALTAARADLNRARLTAKIIYGAVIVAVIVGGGLIVAHHGSDDSRQPARPVSSPTTSSSGSPSAHGTPPARSHSNQTPHTPTSSNTP